MIMPIGMVASSPRTITQKTVTQPVAPPFIKSNSRKPGMRITARDGTRLSDWKTTCPATYPTTPLGTALARSSVPSSRSIANA